MYLLLLLQMAYVFVGNTVHELLGIGFFVCLIIHIVIKHRITFAIFKKHSSKRSKPRLISDIVTVALLICCIVMMLSSMGVSRTLEEGRCSLGSDSSAAPLSTDTWLLPCWLSQSSTAV